MANYAHDLQLTILHDSQHFARPYSLACSIYLEALVLEHPLDGSIFAAGRQFCLEDYAKRAIANNLALSVLYLASLASGPVLDLFSYDFYFMSAHVLRRR